MKASTEKLMRLARRGKVLHVRGKWTKEEVIIDGGALLEVEFDSAKIDLLCEIVGDCN